ncbi:MAG TPA: hypothetical protein VL494_13905 [Steroidobacteraceae bacterium]|jgi:hypothetical protein|nr:hypothetical protein [Steroidobacteraceae bacterium]
MTDLYPPQDPIALGEHYTRHADALTSILHSKGEIAEQLAWRDQRIEQLLASWEKAAAEADTWRFWASKKHGSPLTSDEAAREHIDAGGRFINEARVWLQSRLVRADSRLAILSGFVRNALASGQLEKLEDARHYLDDAERPTPTETAPECTCGARYSARAHEKHCAFQVWSFGRALAETPPQGAHIDPIESGRPGKVAITNAPQGAPNLHSIIDLKVDTGEPQGAPRICGNPSDGGRPCMQPRDHQGACANWDIDLVER